MTVGNMPFLVVGILFLMGVLAILREKNLIKIAIGISIIESAVNMLLITLGYRLNGDVPVHFLSGDVDVMVMPTPQALTLTAIVIALATSALMLSVTMLIYKHYGTLNVDELRRLRG